MGWNAYKNNLVREPPAWITGKTSETPMWGVHSGEINLRLEIAAKALEAAAIFMANSGEDATPGSVVRVAEVFEEYLQRAVK